MLSHFMIRLKKKCPCEPIFLKQIFSPSMLYKQDKISLYCLDNTTINAQTGEQNFCKYVARINLCHIHRQLTFNVYFVIKPNINAHVTESA